MSTEKRPIAPIAVLSYFERHLGWLKIYAATLGAAAVALMVGVFAILLYQKFTIAIHQIANWASDVFGPNLSIAFILSLLGNVIGMIGVLSLTLSLPKKKR